MGGLVPHEAQAVQDRSAIGGDLTRGCEAIDLGFKLALGYATVTTDCFDGGSYPDSRENPLSIAEGRMRLAEDFTDEVRQLI